MTKSRLSIDNIPDDANTNDPEAINASLVQKRTEIAGSQIEKKIKTKLLGFLEDLIKLNNKSPATSPICSVMRETHELTNKIGSIDKSADLLSAEVSTLIKRFNKNVDKMHKKDRDAAIDLTITHYSEYYGQFNDYESYCTFLNGASTRLQELVADTKNLQTKKTKPEYFSSLFKQSEKLDKKVEALISKTDDLSTVMHIAWLRTKIAICTEIYQMFKTDDHLKDTRDIAETEIKLSKRMLKILEPIATNFKVVTETRNQVIQQHQAVLSSSKSSMFGNTSATNGNKSPAPNAPKKTLNKV